MKQDLNLEVEQNPNRADDNQSIITLEKLKKFNEINDFRDGPALQNHELDYEMPQEDLVNEQLLQEEVNDEVHSLNSKLIIDEK